MQYNTIRLGEEFGNQFAAIAFSKIVNCAVNVCRYTTSQFYSDLDLAMLAAVAAGCQLGTTLSSNRFFNQFYHR